MKKLNLLLLLAGFTLLFSCGKKNNTDVKAVASSYFQTNEMFGYGKISVGQIKDQSKVEDIPFVGAMVKQVLDRVQQGVDIKEYIYFGAQRVASDEYVMTAFAKVNNVDSLSSYLKERGNNIEKSNNIFVTEEDGMMLAFNKGFAMLKLGNNLDKKKLTAEFEKLNSGNFEKASEVITKTLDKKSPIVFTASLEQLQNLNADNSRLADMPKSDLSKGIFQCYDIEFNKGNITINTELLGDKKKLDNFDYINHSEMDKKFKISGQEALYLLINTNLAKLESENKGVYDFLMKQYDEYLDGVQASSPDGKIKNAADLFINLRKFISKDHPLTSLTDGVIFVGVEPNPDDVKKPQINFTMASKNKDLKDYLSTALKALDKDAKISVTDTEISGTIYSMPTEREYTTDVDPTGPIFKMYFDFSYLNNLNVDGMSVGNVYIKPLKNLTMRFDNKNGKIVLNLNDSSKNSLEYLTKYYSSIFTE